MNLYFRLLIAILRNFFKPRIHPMQSTVMEFQVMPWDIDAFGHLNNGRYLQIADVARVGWLTRTGILQLALKKRWGALLGGNCVRYCKTLKPFQRFQVTTRILSWDDRWIFMEHRFNRKDGALVAVSYARAALRSKNTWVTTEEISESICPGIERPEYPEAVKLWLKTDDALVGANSFVHIAGDPANDEEAHTPAWNINGNVASIIRECAND